MIGSAPVLEGWLPLIFFRYLDLLVPLLQVELCKHFASPSRLLKSCMFGIGTRLLLWYYLAAGNRSQAARIHLSCARRNLAPLLAPVKVQ